MYSNSLSAYSSIATIHTAERLSQLTASKGKQKKEVPLWLLLFMLMPLTFSTGCVVNTETEAGAQSTPSRAKAGEGSTAVDVAIAKTGVLQEPLEYTGTTQPAREVSLRAQVEGRLLSLQADVGDPVQKGQILARLDDSLLQTSVTQGQAELAALQSEVARAQTQVTNARSQAEQARAELKQAQVDAERLRSLSAAGAIAKQQAELAQTSAATAQQRLNAAIAQIATEQQAVAVAQGRVEAQRATIAQARERQSYTLLASPITGVVVAKSEPGNLIQPGGEILRIADFSSLKVVVQVSDKDISQIRVGQSVKVGLDAMPNEKFTGQVTRILPAPTARTAVVQIPVEITIPNSNGRIGSQLVAEIKIESSTQPRVVVPQSALQGEGNNKGSRSSANAQSPNPKFSKGTMFVVTGEGNQATVKSRPVQVGTSANGQVEILSGLKPGERFVAQSEKPLKDGDRVGLSPLSQTSEKQEQR
ncbi:efflux RND transporter periplasmic adaptor subunit [Allocoleopsis sp.]|uniref:efflux RND transporter periplasmic adaptor subunit n=1 Tax=Allocoleopsis sp. TaxID=3088169 RepID=UPI002FD78D0C